MPDSNAIVNFRETLGMAGQLLQLESQYNDPPAPIDSLVVSGLRGGAAVLMVAAFESFLRDVILERLAPFGTSPPKKPLTSLPDKMQTESIYASLEGAMHGPRHGGPKMKRIDRLPDIRRSAKLIIDDVLDVAAISNTRGNPGPDTLSDMLKSIGIEEPFVAIRLEFDRRWRRPESFNFLRDKLDEIVLRRHKVAHAADVLNISRTDLQIGLEFLHTLSETIDAFLESHTLAL